jgi:hypothetical protein
MKFSGRPAGGCIGFNTQPLTLCTVLMMASDSPTARLRILPWIGETTAANRPLFNRLGLLGHLS